MRVTGGRRAVWLDNTISIDMRQNGSSNSTVNEKKTEKTGEDKLEGLIFRHEGIERKITGIQPGRGHFHHMMWRGERTKRSPYKKRTHGERVKGRDRRTSPYYTMVVFTKRRVYEYSVGKRVFLSIRTSEGKNKSKKNYEGI